MSTPLHVEVVQKRQSRLSKERVEALVNSLLTSFVSLSPGTTIAENDIKDLELIEHVQSIRFCDIEHDKDVSVAGTELFYHVYKLDTFGAEADSMTDTTSGEEFTAANVWALPSQEFHGLWESLIYDSKLKVDIVRYIETAFYFADLDVDSKLVTWNRVVLLHGPPGTGKTSLCRALAQKVAVRLGERFPRARLIEINAHGLFSKWFSESGKLVARLFEHVDEIVADPRLLACVLLDEVESLTHARRAALASLEPSDSIRAVNALLTQLDRLQRRPNVLVFTTSNVTAAIDVAFIDRADLKYFVGPPSRRAAYEILRGCCVELMARGVVAPRKILFSVHTLEDSNFVESESSRTSLRLWEVAREAAAVEMSGRSLRRLPFLAVASCGRALPRDLLSFVAALQTVLQDQVANAATMEHHT